LVVSTGFAVLTPTKVPPSFLYAAVTTDSFIEYLTVNAHGSAYPAVRADTFENADLVIPSSAVLKKFGAIGQPIREKIACNASETRTLAALRDLLLPKLLSGEIRVAEAEERLEAAGA
jgi:type I restriction enzyme S subunit